MDDLLNFSPSQQQAQAKPGWVDSMFNFITQLLALQPTITVHRSKLCSLFDDLRSLMKSFNPSPNIDHQTLQKTCATFVEMMGKTRQLVYACSSTHWTQSSIQWPHQTVLESVLRIRETLSKCIVRFGAIDATQFILPEADITAQNNVDILQLKGSLIDYQTSLKEQAQTPQVQQVVQMINERLNSIGPLEGIQDGPSLAIIPPFLPEKLNMVLDHTDFMIGETIGTGTFGSVHVGTMTQTNKRVAIKVLHMKTLGGRQLETFKREVWTMATINHPSLLHLVGVTLTPPFCIVTELLKCSLFDRMKFLTPTRRSIIALRISQGMEQLHAARIIHRDLKSSNILLDEDDMPRVCDFGLVGFKKHGTHTGFVGTAQWMAPEILRSSPFYDEKVDVYSFAVLLWELLTLQEPYQGVTQDQLVMAVIERGARPPIPSHFGPPKLVKLIECCWAENPQDRPRFEQITAALSQPEFHFVGTNEDEFAAVRPATNLASDIVHAYDSGNWRKLDSLLIEVNPEACNENPDLITTILSLFQSLDSERQATIVRSLPKMTNFEKFVAMIGYNFVISLFSKTEIVVDALAESFRTLEITSKAFRQRKLIVAMSHSTNRNILLFLADLCQCYDIAEQVAKFNLPISQEGLEFEILTIYSKLLNHEQLIETISSLEEPMYVARVSIELHPELACRVLAQYPFNEGHLDFVNQMQLIPSLYDNIKFQQQAITALQHLLIAMPSKYLETYPEIINSLLDKYPQFYENQSLLQKLSQIPGIVVKQNVPQTPQPEPLLLIDL